MNKNTKIVLIIFAVLVFFLIIISGASNRSDEAIKKTEIKETSTIDYSVRKEMKENYMLGCNEEGDLYEYCNCTFDYLVSELGWDGLINIMMDYYLSGEYQKIMVDAAFHCVDEIEGF